MKKLILSTLVAVGLIGSATALADSIPVKKYSELIIGKWKLPRDTYNFSPKGTFRDTPMYGETIVTGTWKVIGKKLFMISGNQTDNPIITFTTPDQCEWEYPNSRVFLAYRISQ
jgi:hypothetical protein